MESIIKPEEVFKKLVKSFYFKEAYEYTKIFKKEKIDFDFEYLFSTVVSGNFDRKIIKTILEESSIYEKFLINIFNKYKLKSDKIYLIINFTFLLKYKDIASWFQKYKEACYKLEDWENIQHFVFEDEPYFSDHQKIRIKYLTLKNVESYTYLQIKQIESFFGFRFSKREIKIFQKKYLIFYHDSLKNKEKRIKRKINNKEIVEMLKYSLKELRIDSVVEILLATKKLLSEKNLNDFRKNLLNQKPTKYISQNENYVKLPILLKIHGVDLLEEEKEKLIKTYCYVGDFNKILSLFKNKKEGTTHLIFHLSEHKDTEQIRKVLKIKEPPRGSRGGDISSHFSEAEAL